MERFKSMWKNNITWWAVLHWGKSCVTMAVLEKTTETENNG